MRLTNRTRRLAHLTMTILMGLFLVGMDIAAATPSAQAATSTILPLHAIRSNDCTGEQIEIMGTIHLVYNEQPGGGQIGHFNYQNTSGIGLTSGDIFRVTSTDLVHLSAPFPSDITAVSTFHLISQGQGDNLLVHVLYHITVNAQGDITTEVMDLTTQCL
jgi:hypothetical protein